MLLVRYYDIVIGYIIGPIFRYTYLQTSQGQELQNVGWHSDTDNFTRDYEY